MPILAFLLRALVALFRLLRRRSAPLLVVAIVLAWPHAQDYLEQFLLWANPGDKKAALAHASWFSLGNVLSKLVATAFVAAFGFFFMWCGMKFTQPSLPTWAKAKELGFKHSFTNLSDECKLKYFTIYWFGSLFFFALLFLAASGLA